MRAMALALALLVPVLISGCAGLTSADERNPYFTATETYGTSLLGGDDDDDDTSAGSEAEVEFRETMTLTLANLHATAELNTSFVAWVSPSSIRSGEQQDELLADGYYQLDEEVELGTAFTLVPGTFVYGGEGLAGATTVRLDETGDEDSETAVELDFTMIVPDAILVYSQPPVSCDTVAFYFTVDGDPLTSEGLSAVGDLYAGAATSEGGLKTLAQIDAYECDPFEPGLFLRTSGGSLLENEFYEGQDIRIEFSSTPDDDGHCAWVTRTNP